MNETHTIDADWDPCPRRMSSGAPCDRPRHHVGHCGISEERSAAYRRFIADIRDRSKGMSREEIAGAVEYHLLAWRVLRNEYNGR